MSKEDALSRVREAQAQRNAADEQLKAAVEDYEEYVQEEEAYNRAIFLGYEPGDEEGIERAKELAQESRQARMEANNDDGSTGPTGGIA